MPNPFWQEQGERMPLFEKVTVNGQEVEKFKSWQEVKPGELTQEQFDKNMSDLT